MLPTHRLTQEQAGVQGEQRRTMQLAVGTDEPIIPSLLIVLQAGGRGSVSNIKNG